MVQNAGMTALAFNDGIYHKNLTMSVEFDTNIAVCYWDATSTKYAPAATLAGKGFKIINTHNKWYYVIGKENITGSSWGQYAYTCEYAKQQMSTTNSCLGIDGDSNKTTPAGCMAAIWCDYPAYSANWTNVESYIQTLAEYNSAYFTEVKAPEEVDLPAVNDPETNVSVVVKGQNGQSAAVTVEAKAARTEGLPASAEEAVSYEITPSVENTAYTGAGKVTLPVPAEWKDNTDRVRGYIVTNGQVETIQGSYDAATGKYAFDVTHFSEMGLILLAADAAYPEKDIYVTVGGTATENVTGANHAGNYTTDDESVASVTVTGQNETTEPNYSKASTTYKGILPSLNTSTTWQKTSYFYKDGENYYPVYAYRYYTSTWLGGYYTYYYGYSQNDSPNNVRQLGSSQREDYPISDVYKENGTKVVSASTTITFKGNKDGDTSVIIGGVKYNIHVTKEDTSKVDPLPIQLWITNIPIEVDTSGYEGGSTSGSYRSNNNWSEQKAWYVDVSASAAYGEKGVELSKVLPASMTRYENNITYWIAKQTDKAPMNLVLWSGRIHNKADSNIQKIWDVDYSNSGDEFTYVRYYGGKWAVSSDQSDWIVVTGANSTTSYSSCTQQLAAYYMIRTKITSEVSTDVADWGYISKDESYSNQIATGNYVMLDFAVKYEGGTRNPNTFPQTDKTFVFHCNTGDNSGAVKQDSSGNYYRQLNNFRGMNSGDYEIYMVTVTMTEDAASDTLSSTTSYAYNGEEQIVWAIDQKTHDNCGLNDYQAITSGDTTYSGCKIGGDPYVRGVEVYNKHGALITYYIRAKATPDSLTVHYVNRKTGEEFYKYSIVVEQGVTFDPDFKQTEPNTTNLTGNTVKNSLGVTETITAKLEEISKIGAQYKYSKYTCVDTSRNVDGKDVYLYYEFDSTKTFVVDFGLPLVIKPSDITESLGKAKIEKMSVDDSLYATITTNLKEFSLTYTLTATIDGQDDINVTYYGTNPGTGKPDDASYTLSIIPASTVYYEDSFATFNSGAGAAADAKWSTDGTEQTANQLLEVLGDKTNLYGYDKAYENCTTFSMGSAHKVTVTADMAKNWANHTDSAWPTATFTFKGTGFDVISLTDNDSGVITCEVKNAKGEKVYSTFINNYYGYKYENGSFVAAANGSNNKLYQLPIIKVAGQPYDTYTVTLTAAYGEYFDKTGDSQYSFWLDAIRVYDPMGKNYADYNKESEKEGYPQYFELRDALAKTADDNYKAVLIEGTVAAEQTDYRNFGPNHEVYLAKDQTLAFKLDGDRSKIATVQLGLKAVDGAATYTIGNAADKKVNTATDMYYDITESAKSGTILIRNTGDAILSLTNVKVTFKEQATASLAIMSDTAINEAVQMVRAMYAPEEVQPFTPERFEASWNRSSVRAGEKATLTVKTSEDVEAITVDGVTIDTYRTRTQRTGWGWNAKKVTYREFTYTITASETADHEIVAVNAEGTASEAITATLTVRAAAQRPGIGGWLNKLFSRWF